MQITQQFDGGNIVAWQATMPMRSVWKFGQTTLLSLSMVLFPAQRRKDSRCQIGILNAAGAAYPDGFRDYRVCYSYDRENWLRHETNLTDGVLSFDFIPGRQCVLRLLRSLLHGAASPTDRRLRRFTCSTSAAGQTLDGQDLDLLRFSLEPDTGKPGNRKQCWFIARQHRVRPWQSGGWKAP